MLRRKSGIFVLFCIGMLVMTGSLSAVSAQTTYIHPIDDTGIAMNHPSQSYGSDSYMSLRGITDGFMGFFPLIKFDLSNIPAGSNIVKARLHLYYFFWSAENPAGHLLKVYRVMKDWNEETACWNNRPTIYGTSTASAYCPSTVGTWVTWTVTSDVRNFVSGVKPNHGWIIKDMNSQSGALIKFYSKEAVQRSPVLEIVYNT
jgi:hypothetical protein